MDNHFKPGDYVSIFQDDYTGAGKIIDILKSEFTGMTAYVIKFIRNIGNDNNDRYGGDVLFIDPNKKIGVNPEAWRKITKEEAEKFISIRKYQLIEKIETY